MGIGKKKSKRKHLSGTPEKLTEEKRQKTLFECVSPVVYTEEKDQDMAHQDSASMESMLQATKATATLDKKMDKVVELLEVIVNRFQPELEAVKEGLNAQQTEIDELRKVNKELTWKVTGLEGNLARVEKVMDNMKEELLDLKARSMRDNLIIQGIEEGGQSESRDKLVWELRRVLANTLRMSPHDIDKINVDRCHRIGAKKGNGKPRPVVYKITPSWAKDVILYNTRNIPRASRIKVFEQFPQEIQERRKRLIPVLKEKKAAKKKVRLAVDKLIIEGKEYRDPATPTLDMSSDTVDIRIHHSGVVTQQGSSFQGHVATIDNINLKESVLHTLYRDKSVAKATHNIWALRIKQGSNIITSWEDDGEYHAGRALAEILDKAEMENKMLIVTRWYGGIHMGDKRFDCIKDVAEKALAFVCA